ADGEDGPQMEADSEDEFYEGDEQYSHDAGEGETWAEPDWVESNADGTFTITPPEGVTIDDGVANFPVEVANEELPLGDDVTIESNGSMTVELPEGSTYSEGLNAMILPAESVELEKIPEQFEAYAAPDGSIAVPMPADGMEYNADAGTVNFSNEIANILVEDNVSINPDGSVDVTLPDNGVEYNDDGTITMEPEAATFMDAPPPEYIDQMDCAEYNPDGSCTFTPPEGVDVSGGIAVIQTDAIEQIMPIDDNVNFTTEGTMEYTLPEGCDYNVDYNYVTVPPGEFSIEQLPDNIDGHINPDGSMTATMPDGCDYNSDANSVTFDNFTTNEMLPDNMHMADDGTMVVALPESTEYYQDGTLSIPSEDLDFVEHDAPNYVADVTWSEYNPDGSYTFHPPEECNCYPEDNMVKFDHEFAQTEFEEHIPEDVTINPDGTMNIKLPDDISFDATSGTLSFPVGSEGPGVDDVPPEFNFTQGEDGSVTVTLPAGVDYLADSGEVHFNNYWTNELTPEPVEIYPDGHYEVQMPNTTEWHEDGSCTVPEYSCDFMENPEPPMVNGCEMFECNPDGSYSVPANDGMTFNGDAGTCQMSTEYIHENFDNYVDDGMHFHPDGTMSVDLPEGTSYDPAAGSLTFPTGEMNPAEIPNQIEYTVNPDGSVVVTIPDGIQYDADAGQVHMDNYWTNEVTPEPCQFDTEGNCTVNMPSDTYYYDDGSCTIPEHQAEFMEHPEPDYANDGGPDWASSNPDGSVTVEPPEGIVVNGEAGTITFSHDQAMEHLGEDIPEEVQLNGDGTMNIGVPEGTTYNADANSLTFPAGDMHSDEIPPGIDYTLNDNGSMTVNLAEGMEWNADSSTVHMANNWVNEFAPDPINIGTDGSFTIDLPDDTQYFENGSFVISAESADFMDGGEHHDQYQDPNYNPDGPNYQN
ncbi:MAG: hypothetical protein HN623_03925, partial [Bdellovibrionales bacterium]|nr:hypothetical protein [Bdellovibrionales bacterium]